MRTRPSTFAPASLTGLSRRAGVGRVIAVTFPQELDEGFGGFFVAFAVALKLSEVSVGPLPFLLNYGLVGYSFGCGGCSLGHRGVRAFALLVKAIVFEESDYHDGTYCYAGQVGRKRPDGMAYRKVGLQ